jgi:DNA-directed RNA polymerase subunit RPC12/RpoP
MRRKNRIAVAVVGMPEGTDAEDIAAGSMLYPCVRCGAKVWMAPTSQRAIKRAEVQPVCIPCARKAEAREGVEFQGFLPGAVGEAMQHISRKTSN